MCVSHKEYHESKNSNNFRESCHLSNDYAKNDGLQYYWGNKGKTKQIACCICYILSHGGEGNCYLEKINKIQIQIQ